MFTLTESADVLHIVSSAQTIDILPGCGALLNSWTVHTPSGERNLIEGYDNALDFGMNAEAKGFRSCKLSPYVCRLADAAYMFKEKSYKIGGFHLNGAGLHGLLYNKPFRYSAGTMRSDGADIELTYEYNAEDAGYPFPFSMRVVYVLTAPHRIEISTTVKNVGEKIMPLADGWHPYFKLEGNADDWTLKMPVQEQLEFNDELLPTGNRISEKRFEKSISLRGIELDNSFLLKNSNDHTTPAAVLENPQSGENIEVFNLGNYPIVQVYIPPHRRSVAIENLSAAPDAFNNGMYLIELAPGEEASFKCAYQYSTILT